MLALLRRGGLWAPGINESQKSGSTMLRMVAFLCKLEILLPKLLLRPSNYQMFLPVTQLQYSIGLPEIQVGSYKTDEGVGLDLAKVICLLTLHKNCLDQKELD